MTKLKFNKNLKLDPKLIAFPYQEQAIDTIRDLQYAAIFHEQGLGKTKIGIDVALYWISQKIVDSVLIVTKKTLISNWQRECQVHSYLKPAVLTQSRKNNYNVFNSPSRIILANYEVITSEFERFKLFLKSRDVGVILDESARIKSPNSIIAQNFHKLSTLFKRRIIMTGTPVANRPCDIWSQIWFLDQGKSLGGDFNQFASEVDIPSSSFGQDTCDAFETSLQKIWKDISMFSVRETKNSDIISLPDKVFESVITEWEYLQSELYYRYRDELRAIIIKEGIPTEDNAESVLKRLLRLIQIASNPKLVDQSYSGKPGKLIYLIDIIEKTCRKNEKCIVWSTFNENVDWLTLELKTFGTCKIHGKLPIEIRNRSVEKFLNDSKTNILIATPGAAKEGLTLTSANHAIFYDRGFSLDDYLQAQDRIHRISQKKTCYIYNLIMEDSIDQWVDLLLYAKSLAAKLAQGDIQIEEYKRNMTYNFGEMLKDILNINQKSKL